MTPSSLLSFSLFSIFFCTLIIDAASTSLQFADVTDEAGILPTPGKLKYGGASVADLDGDGWPDLLLGHHDSRSMSVYFNSRNGTFTLSPFRFWRDIHGINAFRMRPLDRALHFTASVGGAFGTRLTAPILFRVENRTIIDVTATSGSLSQAFGRGRTVLSLPLRRREEDKKYKRNRPDVLALGAVSEGIPNHYAMRITSQREFKIRNIRGDGFEQLANSHAIVTDIDNDGDLEVLSFKTFSVWKLTADFTLSDVTDTVLGSGGGKRYVGTVGVAELDFDNDGLWDIYLTRSATAQVNWVRRRPIHDALLRNVDGKEYDDVTVSAGVPIGLSTVSRGVTTGDFDNDGYVDVVISRYNENSSHPYVFLRNNQGDGTFSVRYDIPGLDTREADVYGDAPTAVDYDLDGKLDLILSEGDWFNKSHGGSYRVLRNDHKNNNGFLLVRVKNAPRRRATSMHAVVRVEADNGLRMMRRVGTPGSMVSNSFVETVHFGLGNARRVRNVSVSWVDGSVRYKENVAINGKIAFGVL